MEQLASQDSPEHRERPDRLDLPDLPVSPVSPDGPVPPGRLASPDLVDQRVLPVRQDHLGHKVCRVRPDQPDRQEQLEFPAGLEELERLDPLDRQDFLEQMVCPVHKGLQVSNSAM